MQQTESTPKVMAPFDIGDALVQGFKRVADKDFILQLVLLPAFVLALLYAGVIYFLAEPLSEIMMWSWESNQALLSGGAGPDTVDMLPYLKQAALPYAVMMGGWLILYAMTESAMHRHVLGGTLSEGGADKTYSFRFGRDEVNVIISQVLIFVIWFGVYIGGAVIVALIAAALGNIAGWLSVLFAIPAVIVLLCLLVYVPVKLCPAAALLVKSKKLSVLSAWSVSKGRFWPYFGALVIMIIVGYIGFYVVYMLAVIAATGNLDMIAAVSGLGSENPAATFDTVAQRFQNPVFILIGFVSLFIYCASCIIFMLMIASISTYAVKLTQDDDAGLFS